MSAPRDPEGAIILAALFRQCGGSFVIDCFGARRLVSDLDAIGDRMRVSVMVEAMIKRLHEVDLQFLFDAYADCQPAVPADFEEPMRRAA